MKKASVVWLFSVIVLAFMLVLSVVLGVTGYYFSVAYLNSVSDLVVGNSFIVSVKANEASVASFTFDGGYLPNELIPQVIQIDASNLNEEVRIRVKSQIFGIDSDYGFDFITSEHFQKGEDGYYYFDGVLKGGNKIMFCNYVAVPKEVDFSSGEKYVFTLIVETLESSLDYKNIWKIV